MKPHRLMLILNLLLAVAVAGGIVHVFGDKPQSVTEPPAVGHSVRRDDSPLVSAEPDYEAILKSSIFKTTPQPAEPAPAAPEPQSAPLKLKLLGTIAGKPAIARAVIEDQETRLQDLYKIGDSIRGAKIERIERNRVVLLHGGRQIVLGLNVTETSELASPAPAADDLPRTADLHDAVKVISENEMEIDKQAMLARLGGLEAIMRTMEVRPHVVDGATVGLQITGIENVSMARFVGIENGDVIQNVNGQDLNSLQKALQVFRKARYQPEIDVQILRGDEVIKRSFGIK